MPLPALCRGRWPDVAAVVRKVHSKARVLSGRGNPRPEGGFPLKAKLLQPEHRLRELDQ